MTSPSYLYNQHGDVSYDYDNSWVAPSSDATLHAHDNIGHGLDSSQISPTSESDTTVYRHDDISYGSGYSHISQTLDTTVNHHDIARYSIANSRLSRSPDTEDDTCTITRRPIINFKGVQKIANLAKKNVTYQRYRKPPYPYVGLIVTVIQLSPEQMLTLQDIQENLMETFDFFKDSDYLGWRDSVRHNLSHSKCFSKTDRLPGGRSCKWSVDLTKVPSMAFRLQDNSVSKEGGWANNLHDHLGVPRIVLPSSTTTKAPEKNQLKSNSSVNRPCTPLITNLEKKMCITPISSLRHSSDLTRDESSTSDILTPVENFTIKRPSRKRKPKQQNKVTKKVKTTPSTEESCDFSPRGYFQLKTLISDRTLQFGVPVDAAIANLSGLCQFDSTSEVVSSNSSCMFVDANSQEQIAEHEEQHIDYSQFNVRYSPTEDNTASVMCQYASAYQPITTDVTVSSAVVSNVEECSYVTSDAVYSDISFDSYPDFVLPADNTHMSPDSLVHSSSDMSRNSLQTTSDYVYHTLQNFSQSS